MLPVPKQAIHAIRLLPYHAQALNLTGPCPARGALGGP
mgnify:CR=1 FL=1